MTFPVEVCELALCKNAKPALLLVSCGMSKKEKKKKAGLLVMISSQHSYTFICRGCSKKKKASYIPLAILLSILVLGEQWTRLIILVNGSVTM